MPNDSDKIESKRIVESGKLIVMLHDIRHKISKLESNQQEPPVSSSEDDVYVVVEKSSIKGALASHTFSGKEALEDAKGYIEAMKSSIGKRRIARLVFLDEEK